MASSQGKPLTFPASTLLTRRVSDTSERVANYRRYLDKGQQNIRDAFIRNISIVRLLRARSRLIDKVISQSWRDFDLSQGLALVATGGYGRRELHPGSDIDLVILVDGELTAEQKNRLENWLAFLWDIGLEIGHAVRSIAQTRELAERDITIATSLMESRLLAGTPDLYERMLAETGRDNIWPGEPFFEAKCQEQLIRHRKFKETSYNLEPNIKANPGGLRDIQLILWVARRHFEAETLHDLTRVGLFTPREYRGLLRAQRLLWRVRFALHLVAGRREDRLLFEHQGNVAELLGYRDTETALAIEQMMKAYYQAAMRIRNLNQLFIQLFTEMLEDAADISPPQPIDDRFQIRRNRLETVDPEVFARHPDAMLEAFNHYAERDELRTISAGTLRQIRAHQPQINRKYRSDPLHKALFLRFLHHRHHKSHAFALIKRTNVLAAMIPLFGKIEGQMQFDLFHAYTVDEHTLFLLKNLVHFCQPERRHEFPLCSAILARLDKPEIIYLSALFHDIAKGRGGDHSELGAEDALDYCLDLGLSQSDAETVAWLVKNHLLMSMTAQRKDIADPKVVRHFASRIPGSHHLDLLYVLTVADIRATNPTLWNSWKAALLKELYLSAQKTFQFADEEQADATDKVKEEALAMLASYGIGVDRTLRLWQGFDKPYFGKYHPEQLAWQSRLLLEKDPQVEPVVSIKPHRSHAGTEIFIAIPDQENLFATITALLNQNRLSIQDATLHTTPDSLCLDTFIVLEENNEPVSGDLRLQEIRQLLDEKLQDLPSCSLNVTRPVSRRVRHFTVATEVRFSRDPATGKTLLELTALDRPGLLAMVGQAFRECGVRIHSAKIVTLGEKVEDTFIISKHDNSPFDDPEAQEALKDSIINQLS